MRWMIYGANGYTGRLTARRAASQRLNPILAGRRARPLRQLAEELALEHRVFRLDDRRAIAGALEGVDAVVHMAGPFSATHAPMVDACLAAGVHYLDVTGEIEVFEQIFARDGEAREAGVALVPGVGLDVVPTDCLALSLSAALPAATHLDLALVVFGSPSAGTLRTIAEGLPRGGWARIEGRLRAVPAGWRNRRIDFPSGKRMAFSVPLGDLACAHRSTAIANITTFTVLPRGGVAAARIADRWPGVAASRPVQGLLRAALKPFGRRSDRPPGGRVEVWGEAMEPEGESRSGAMLLPDPYLFTADAAIAALRRVREGIGAGAHTPAQAFGADFVASIEGVEVRPIEREPLFRDRFPQ